RERRLRAGGRPGDPFRDGRPPCLSGKLAWLLEDQKGDVLRVGRLRRNPPRWMMRALKHRDRECRFPGCGTRRYLQAHHIRHWDQGGPTELDNLVLVCFFHHKLVHEYGWRVMRERNGTVTWFRPNGKRYRPGPGPPRLEESPLAVAAAAF
ncbi:MAG: HNH endonuclease, partial [Actinomycetota bacterium]|nr:HNH endonuclease [Actinomycetota bacterium]